MLTLFGNLDSGNVHKVQMVLARSGQPFRRVEVSQARGEPRRPEFLALNPMGKVPVLLLEDGDVMTEPGAIAHFREQIRRIGHALHTAGHTNRDRPGENGIDNLHCCLHARAAHLVDRSTRNGFRQARLDRRLTGRCLALPGRQDTAHDHFIHIIFRDIRVLQYRVDCLRP